jgi:hypothetical protein
MARNEVEIGSFFVTWNREHEDWWQVWQTKGVTHPRFIREFRAPVVLMNEAGVGEYSPREQAVTLAVTCDLDLRSRGGKE